MTYRPSFVGFFLVLAALASLRLCLAMPSARHGKAWQGMARHGKAWQSMARHRLRRNRRQGIGFGEAKAEAKRSCSSTAFLVFQPRLAGYVLATAFMKSE